MVILRLKADGTTSSVTVNMTEQEEFDMLGSMPTTLQEKIEAFGDNPELNEIMAQLVDIPEPEVYIPEESEEEE